MRFKNDYSLILPAFNEATHIGDNLQLLSSLDCITEIIVVDDGSTDDTSDIASRFKKVNIIRNSKNMGKTQSVIRGVHAAQYEDVVFYDADLIGMKPKYILDMLRTYEAGANMVIMDKGAQPWFFRKLLRTIPAQSGTRVLSKENFLEIHFKNNASFELEPRINAYYLKGKRTIKIVEAPTVKDLRKFQKYDFVTGLSRDLYAIIEISTLDGVRGLPDIYRTFWKINRISRPNS